MKSNCLFAPFAATARAGLFLPRERGGKKGAKPHRELGQPGCGWENPPSKHQATRGDPHPGEAGSPGRRKEGWIPPCRAAAALPPSIPAAAALARAFEVSFLPLPPAMGWFKSRFRQAAGRWGPRHRAAASRAPLGTAPRPAPGSVSAEEGVLPVSAEFLSVSPQACPWPFQVGVRLRSRSSPSDLQHVGRGGEDTAEDA